MNDLIISRLDEIVWDGLRRLAADHGRTVPEEARDLLRQAIAAPAAEADGPAAADEPGLGTRLAANFAGLGSDFEVPELRGPFRLQVPDFDLPEFDQ